MQLKNKNKNIKNANLTVFSKSSDLKAVKYLRHTVYERLSSSMKYLSMCWCKTLPDHKVSFPPMPVKYDLSHSIYVYWILCIEYSYRNFNGMAFAVTDECDAA